MYGVLVLKGGRKHEARAAHNVSYHADRSRGVSRERDLAGAKYSVARTNLAAKEQQTTKEKKTEKIRKKNKNKEYPSDVVAKEFDP